MSIVEVKVKDFPRVFKEYSDRSIEEMKAAAARGITNYMPKLVADSPVDTGEYANSWDMVEQEDRVLLGNFAPHAPIIEFGARPFRPPLKPLLAWAKRVLKSSSQPPKYEPKVWKLAVGVQKKIEKEGMKPRFILKNAIPKILKEIRMELDRQVLG